MLLPTLALNVSTFLAHRLVPLQETGVVVEPTLTISLSRSGPFVHSVFLEDCLCATQIFVELNGCLSCVALQNTTEYSELTRQAGGTSLLTFPSSVFSTHCLTFFHVLLLFSIQCSPGPVCLKAAPTSRPSSARRPSRSRSPSQHRLTTSQRRPPPRSDSAGLPLPPT